MTTKNILLGAMTLLMLLVVGCVKDELLTEGATSHKGKRIYVSTASHTVVETRAATNENAINDLYVLVFDKSSGTLTDHKAASILSNGEIYIELAHTTAPSQVVMMANVSGIIAKAPSNIFAEGATLTSVSEKLLLYPEMVVQNPATGCNITTLPMLSQIIEYPDGIGYNTELGTTDTQIELTHRLSKMSAQSNVSTMQIDAISLRYAPKSGGQLLVYNGADATPQITDRINYFGQDAEPKLEISNQSLNIFSSDNTTTTNNPMELVVKARYATDTQSSYYRIKLDRKAADGTRAMFDFEPGKNYLVTFTKVTASGYPSLREALNNDYSNVEYQITDDSDMSEVLTNGQYMLGTTNSDCKIYGDYDPSFEYPIVDIVTDAPATAEIELTPIGKGFTIATTPAQIKRDGSVTQLKIKFQNQFTSGSVRVRVGNLTKVITFSIELDPPYIQMDDVLNARIASGFENRTIALSRSTYDEKIPPTDLTDNIDNMSDNPSDNLPIYVHFNKITLGDQPRIGEAYFAHKINIHHTKVMVVQKPWVEIEGVKFATGNVVVGWHQDKTRRYKIGGANEYGVVFIWRSRYGIDATDKQIDDWTINHYVYTPRSLTANTIVDARNGYPKLTTNVIYNPQLVNAGVIEGRNDDPCSYISTGGSYKWRTMYMVEADILKTNKGGNNSSASGFHIAPNGNLIKNGEMFLLANGRRILEVRARVRSYAHNWVLNLDNDLRGSYVYLDYERGLEGGLGHDWMFGNRCVAYTPIIIGNFEVATRDYFTCNWPTAMGIDPAIMNSYTGTAMGSKNTGCNTLGKGWRMPIQQELKLIYENQDYIVAKGGARLGGNAYLSGSSVPGRPHNAQVLRNISQNTAEIAGTFEEHSKIVTTFIRCVKNK